MNIFKTIFLLPTLLMCNQFLAMELEERGHKRKFTEKIAEQPTKKQAVDAAAIFSTANILIINNTHKELELYPKLYRDDKRFKDPERIIVLKPGNNFLYTYKLIDKIISLPGAQRAIRYDGWIFFREKNSTQTNTISFYKELQAKGNDVGASVAEELANAKKLIYQTEINHKSTSKEEPLSKATQFFNIIVDIRGNETKDFEESTITTSISPQQI